jgi:hypothetical protein
MASDGVRRVDMVWNYSARRPAAQRNRALHLLHLGWARVPDILLLPHAAGELRPSASSPDVTLSHVGDDLHPPIRDVCGCATIGASVSVLLHAAILREEPKPPGSLLLLGKGQVFSCVHRPSHPHQVGPLEGGLGDCEDQLP